MSPIRTELHGEVLVIISDNPPVNALSAAVRQGLEEAIASGLSDSLVSAMVIRCDGRSFFAGADISEFDKPIGGPWLGDVIDMIEAADKPVVAAIHGTALGGGCEVALGCHYRIAVPSARIGTPEVKLGLLPGAGGTQRLPRLSGVELALEMVAKGDPISATTALDAGLIDQLAPEETLTQDVIAFAREVAFVRPLPRAAEKVATAAPGVIDAFRRRHARQFKGFDAPAANIACIEKAVSGASFAEGLAFERSEFPKLMTGRQSAAQRHIFFAERQAAKIDDIPKGTPPRPISRVGVVGAGTMGTGIGINFLSAGIPVIMVDVDRDALDGGVAAIRATYESAAAKGRLDREQIDASIGALTPTLNIEDLADCDLVIEAVYEDMAIKQALFARLDAIVKPGAILASNTSFLDIDEIAAATSRPHDVIGMHFFSPANVMKLLEVVRGAETADDVLVTVTGLARRIGKVAVVAGVCHGFIGNRMVQPRQDEAMKLLLEGATPEQVDQVHLDFGMPMGPFQMADLAGVDIGWHRDPAQVGTISEALCAAGRWGQKRQAGFYDYDDKRQRTPSPQVAAIIDDFRARVGTQPRPISSEEIAERTLFPLVNEGARILEEKIAQRPSDIDVVWVYGYGWPAYRGGPMFWAETEGRAKIVAGLEKHGFAVADGLRGGASR